MRIDIRELETHDRSWVGPFLEEQAGSARVVSRGKLHQADRLPGFVAVVSGAEVGLLTYDLVRDEFEVVTLHTRLRRRGVGTRLLRAALKKAKHERCRRLWLITTNDNEPAIAFYRSCGMTLVAVHRGAVALSRKLKPEIPQFGLRGIAIEDEIEFEKRL